MKKKKNRFTTTPIDLMGPLVIGEHGNPESKRTVYDLKRFDDYLSEAKRMGVRAVSIDIWLGYVAPAPGIFVWSHYELIFQHIKAAGLKIAPILSLHHCGGNVNDTDWVPLPDWIWQTLASKVPSGKVEAIQYVSEQGKSCYEYISCWATPLALDIYKDLFRSFMAHFAGYAHDIVEINISLGPTGELRYPSYNQHDVGSGYPHRGTLQCYSELALESFRTAMLRKYKTEAGVKAHWEEAYRDKIAPPEDVSAFFERGDHINTVYGRDLFDWYQDSLLNHGLTLMTTALKVFSTRRAAFKGIPVAAKIPGIGWRVGRWQDGQIMSGDRLAELAAGMIRTSGNDWNSDRRGHGYRPMLKLFRDLQTVCPSTPVILYFTCFEMKDGEGYNEVSSLPEQLCQWVGKEARRLGVPLKGENALSWKLYDYDSWLRMISYLPVPGGKGLVGGYCFLRMEDIFSSHVAYHGLEYMLQAVKRSIK
jgi:hypothetical protein